MEAVLIAAILAGIGGMIYLATSGPRTVAAPAPRPASASTPSGSTKTTVAPTTTTVPPTTTTSALPYSAPPPSTATTTTYPEPNYAPSPPTTSVTQSVEVQEDQAAVAQAQAQVQQDQSTYQSDEATAHFDANLCSEDVQADVNESTNPTDDPQTARLCSTAQGADNTAVDERDTLRRDEDSLAAAEQLLQLAEGQG
jgi:hypothetical protein